MKLNGNVNESDTKVKKSSKYKDEERIS